MSSILKALKKLEEEKSLHEEPREINISREILKQPSENGKMLRWLWLLGSSAAIIIIMLTFALIRKPATTEVIKLREQPLTSQPTAPQAQLQNLPAPTKMSGSVKESRSAPPLSANEPQQEPSRQLPVQSDRSLIRKENVEMPGIAAPAYVLKETERVAKTAPEQTAVNSGADFILSGIAWNSDSADRLAIINGQPTATGATVNGVVVEEILQDRVKMSHNGRIFELLIGKTQILIKENSNE